MSSIQVIDIKKYGLALLCVVSWHFHIMAQPAKKADSLFANQRFSEAKAIYEKRLFQQKKTSPAALLKLAFLEEGLQNPVKTLFYLHQSYLLQPDARLKVRIEDLAAQNKFSGYSVDEADYAYFLYRVYGRNFELGLFSLATLIFLFLIFRKFKGVSLGYSPVFVILLLIPAAYMLNFHLPYKRAILQGDKIFMMSGPSSGASVMDVLEKGHRVEWLGEKDIWFEIKWNEKRGWVKKSDLLFFM